MTIGLLALGNAPNRRHGAFGASGTSACLQLDEWSKSGPPSRNRRTLFTSTCTEMSRGTIRRFDTSHIFGVLTFSMCCAFERDARFFRQAKMSSRFHRVARAAGVAAMLAISSPGFAQSDDVDPELRVQQLENQL